jgi:hypothetical protein
MSHRDYSITVWNTHDGLIKSAKFGAEIVAKQEEFVAGQIL